MGKKEQGFTLIEIVIAMAVYSILLVIMGISAVAFSEIYDRVNNPSTLHRKSVAIQGFITNLWQENNGSDSIDLSDGTVLFKVGSEETAVYFEENKLFFGNQLIDYHESIEDIIMTVDGKYVIFEIMAEEDRVLVTFILLHAGDKEI